MAGQTDDRIRERAHAIWERQGRPDGQEQEHWEQARHEIDNEDAAADQGSAGGSGSAQRSSPGNADETRAPAGATP